MGIPKQNQRRRQDAAISATELCSTAVESEERRQGRRLILKFIGKEKPQLDRAEFQHCDSCRKSYIQQRGPKGSSFTWTATPKALSLFFLDYLCAGLQGGHANFSFRGAKNGSLAASLGDAIGRNTGSLFVLFTELPQTGGQLSKIQWVFDGRNMAGKEENERRIMVKTDFLPPDCVEVFWEGFRLGDLKAISGLAERIRKAWSLELESPLDLQMGNGNPTTTRQTAPAESATAEKASSVSGTPPKPEPPPVPDSQPKPPEPPYQNPVGTVEISRTKSSPERRTKPRSALARKPNVSQLAANEVVAASPKQNPPPAPANIEPPPQPTPVPPPSVPSPKTETVQPKLSEAPKAEPVEEPKSETALATTSTLPLVREFAPMPVQRINPDLFQVSQTGGYWPDDSALLTLGEEEASCPWTLRNAFEGVLIFGATGSGKTSGSGATLAESFLRSGFGGLVMTVKTDEAEHWQRLCEHCGRGNDYVVIRRGGQWKFNILAYEAQRPGQGGGLSENLVSFCRNLLSISSRQQGVGVNDQFWQSAGDQLLNATFDLFLLASLEITFDRLAEFISAAPTAPLADEEAMYRVPIFGSVLSKAWGNLQNPEDQRIFRRALDYWLRIYPALGSKTRSSITLGVFAMLDAFRGRDIPDLISSDTNITPESILSGKIVVLDLPIKEMGHTGVIVQSAWKFLFQTTVERQGNAGNPSRRPVFLWEDEGQYFFSNHDHHFQDTARSSRVSHVILSQNLHNFYKEFGQGAKEAADSVFGNLNTKIFHANPDPTTNEWAAKHFGTEIHSRFTISQAPQQSSKGFWDSLHQMIDPPSTASISASEQREYAVQPEEFNRLRTGGSANDFQVDAYITWLGLSAERERHFTMATFFQNQNL
jgi:hypothetical protein